MKTKDQLVCLIHDALGGNGWAYLNYGGDELTSQRQLLEAVADLIITEVAAELRETRAALAEAQDEISGAHKRLDDYGVPKTSDEAAGLDHALQYRIYEMHKAQAVALGNLRGAVETILNTEPHDSRCRVVSRECNCWQARLQQALDGDK